MINEEKTKSMTRAAVYEKSEERKNIDISNYFREDYMGLQLIKSALAYLVAFVLLCALWGMSGGEELMLQLSQPVYVGGLLKKMIILFAAGLILYEIAVYIYYYRKYESVGENVGEYAKHLKAIQKIYETESSETEEFKTAVSEKVKSEAEKSATEESETEESEMEESDSENFVFIELEDGENAL